MIKSLSETNLFVRPRLLEHIGAENRLHGTETRPASLPAVGVLRFGPSDFKELENDEAESSAAVVPQSDVGPDLGSPKTEWRETLYKKADQWPLHLVQRCC